jgi:cardiolipin synthase
LARYIPNLISLARLCIVPVVLIAVVHGRYGIALAWMAVAGISDAFDGMLARQLRVESRVGAYLDPIADKCLLSGVYFALAYAGAMPWWLTGIVFGRDALMLLAIAVAFLITNIRDFPPSVWGKVSTAIQIVTALAALLAGFLELGVWTRSVNLVFFVITAAATAWSGVHYLWVGVRMLRQDYARAGDVR